MKEIQCSMHKENLIFFLFLEKGVRAVMLNYAELDRKLLLKRAGEFIVNARKKNGITQEGLLSLIDSRCGLNMDRNTLSLIERGRVTTNWLNLMVILHVLEFSFDDFIDFVTDPNS